MQIEPRGRLCRSLGVLAMLALPGSAVAAWQLIPYGSVTAEYNSNVFALPGEEQAQLQNGDRELADTVLRYRAGVEGNLPLGQQKLRALAEARRLDFIHFGHLDHNEYLLGAGMDWRLTSAVDGLLDYRWERRMAPFADRNTSQLTLETERIASGSAHYALDAEWRVEAGLRSRTLDSPLPAFPDFAVEENSVNAALKYLAIDRLVAGVFAEYLRGEFEGVPGAGSFHEESLALTADYNISEVSRIAGQLGYTQRRDEGGGKLSGPTGSVAYHRDLTGRTSADVHAFRRVRSYAGGASSMEETGAGAALAWRATEKIAVTGAAEWIRADFGGADRTDDTQTLALKVNYQAMPWLAVRPYSGYQRRDSSVDLEKFRSAIVGLEVLARFQYPR